MNKGELWRFIDPFDEIEMPAEIKDGPAKNVLIVEITSENNIIVMHENGIVEELQSWRFGKDAYKIGENNE
jgi:hypothetical protein